MALVVCGAGACGRGARPVQGPSDEPAKLSLAYTFAFDDALSTLDARVCFDGPPPSELVCGVDWGRDYLERAWVDAADGQREVQVVDGSISLAGVADVQCVRYVLDLGALSRDHGALRAELRGDAMMANLAFWLWRPRGFREPAGATARFELPQGASISVPWPKKGDSYTLDATAFGFLGYGVVGRYELERVHVAGATIELAVLDGLPAETRANLRPWIESASLMASLPGGRFPRDRALVVVVPAPAGASPVGFGHVVRGGGTSVGIFVREDAALDDLKSDWVAVHEFSHLWLPFVERDDAWLSEGLATYYQEVLRARGGVTSDSFAWRRLWDGARLRDEAEGSLSQESAAMRVNFSFRRVYWAGAAFALMADVELRRRSGGEMTLDRVLDELSTCCATTARPRAAVDVLAQMDRISRTTVFGDLHRRWVLGPELPDLAPLYDELGVTRTARGIDKRDGASGAHIRDAIMQKDTAVAQRISRLGRAGAELARGR